MSFYFFSFCSSWTKKSTFLHSDKHNRREETHCRSLLPSSGQDEPLQGSGATGTKEGDMNNRVDSRKQQHSSEQCGNIPNMKLRLTANMVKGSKWVLLQWGVIFSLFIFITSVQIL